MQKKDKEISNSEEFLGSEEVSPANFQKESLRLLRELTRELGWKYRLWIPLSILLASIFLLPPRLLQFFTENVVRIGEIDGAEFLRQLIIFGLLVAGSLWAGIFLGGVLAEWLRLQIGVRLRSAAMESMLEARIERIDQASRGDWMTRLTSDLSNCEDFLSDSLPEQIRHLSVLIGSAVLFAFHSSWIALIPVVAALFLASLNIFIQKKMAPALRSSREIEGDIFQTMIEGFEGLRTIRSYGSENFFREVLASKLLHLKRVGMRIIKTMSALMGLNEVAAQLVITLIVTLVAYRVAGSRLTALDALVYPFYINLFLNSAKQLVAASYSWNRFFVEGGRLAGLLYDPAMKLSFGGEVKDAVGVASISANDLEVRHVKEGPPVVTGLNLLVECGKTTALMGPSGSGKSTVLEVLAGLRSPSGGELRLSRKGGSSQSISLVPGSMCAFVEQQPCLFAGTIRDNIGLGRSEVDDLTLNEAIFSVGMKMEVDERGGLDAALDDRGRNWSVGQQYRLALCRALVSGRVFFMLDEPFASLDPESIGMVIEALEEAKEAGTGIVLATHQVPEGLIVDTICDL